MKLRNTFILPQVDLFLLIFKVFGVWMIKRVFFFFFLFLSKETCQTAFMILIGCEVFGVSFSLFF